MMTAKRLAAFFLVAASMFCTAYGSQPRLIVVISLDQFPYEYLARFRDSFEANGFNYLLSKGANFAATTYKHANTSTGPGHAVILSGAYGNMNGIIANSWYDTELGTEMYCVQDDQTRLVGKAGAGRSPRNFIGSTFGDELRMQSGFHSKVISLSNKDRAAILLGGKLANGVFWMADSQFVTSTYYASELPPWLKTFNASGRINSFFGATWDRALPLSAYESIDSDSARYEHAANGLGRTFPHRIVGSDSAHITASFYEALLTSPFGSEILEEVAKDAIVGEELGQRGVTDLLCLSFSSNDYVGHSYGPDSHEVLDMTVRTDRILGDLFSFLDERIGLQHCLIALTSDHAVAPIPEYMQTRRMNSLGGRFSTKSLASFCSTFLSRTFGALPKEEPWIASFTGNGIYLNRSALAKKSATREAVARALAGAMRGFPGIEAAFSKEELSSLSPSSTVELRMKHSLHYRRSGDVMYVLEPFLIGGEGTDGTSHGSPYEYDAHVPLIVAGDGIVPGTYMNDASPADLAPTLSALTGVEFPSGREGRILIEALRNP